MAKQIEPDLGWDISPVIKFRDASGAPYTYQKKIAGRIKIDESNATYENCKNFFWKFAGIFADEVVDIRLEAKSPNFAFGE